MKTSFVGKPFMYVGRGRTRAREAARKAFTLIEVLVAMVIFSLVMASLYMSIRTGMRAYDTGITHSEADQLARFTVSQVAEDLRNVYYRNPNQYNITRRQREALLQQQQAQQLKAGVSSNQVDDPTLPELGPKIDLAFRASDAGESDDLTFVRLQNMKRAEDRKAWNLARLHYFIANKTLFRSVDDVKAPPTDEQGNVQPKSDPPQVDKIANHVTSIDYKFGYYYDGEWKTAPDWNSEASIYRNPPTDDDDKNTPVTTPNGTNPNGQPQQQNYDEIPAWVEFTITFVDPKNEEKEKKFRQVVMLPLSQESYVPPEFQNNAAVSKNAFTRRASSGYRLGGQNRGGWRR